MTTSEGDTGATTIKVKPMVYIAGPYSNPDPILNVRRAVEVAERMPPWVIPVIPHLTMLWHLVSPHPLEWWYAHDLDLLDHCDALYRFAGRSAGADREVAHARNVGIPTFEEYADDDGFDAWLAGRAS